MEEIRLERAENVADYTVFVDKEKEPEKLSKNAYGKYCRIRARQYFEGSVCENQVQLAMGLWSYIRLPK